MLEKEIKRGHFSPARRDKDIEEKIKKLGDKKKKRRGRRPRRRFRVSSQGTGIKVESSITVFTSSRNASLARERAPSLRSEIPGKPKKPHQPSTLKSAIVDIFLPPHSIRRHKHGPQRPSRASD